MKGEIERGDIITGASLMVLVGVFIYALYPILAPGSESMIEVGTLDKFGNPTNSQLNSFVNDDPGVYYLYFDVVAKNTGNVKLDFLKITDIFPTEISDAFDLERINNIDVGETATFTTWNSCDDNSDCGDNEECVGSDPKCAIPTQIFEEEDQPVRFGVTVEGSWTNPHTSEEDTIIKTGYVDLEIEPDVVGGFDLDILPSPGDNDNEISPGAQYLGLAVHPAGHQQERTPSYWKNGLNFINSKVPDKEPVVVWVLSVAWEGDECHLTFPWHENHPYMSFSSTDENELYLDAFDEAGASVWLSIEPQMASVDDLIDIVLTKYGHHPSITGVSVDLEWLGGSSYPNGRPATNGEAYRWLEKIKSYNPSYRLLFWHWETNRMPSNHLEDVVYAYDPQGFSSYSQMINEYEQWGNYFSGGDVSIIIGFDSDYSVWSQFSDPADKIATDIFNNVPNAKEVYWASWSLPEIYG